MRSISYCPPARPLDGEELAPRPRGLLWQPAVEAEKAPLTDVRGSAFSALQCRDRQGAIFPAGCYAMEKATDAPIPSNLENHELAAGSCRGSLAQLDSPPARKRRHAPQAPDSPHAIIWLQGMLLELVVENYAVVDRL